MGNLSVPPVRDGARSDGKGRLAAFILLGFWAVLLVVLYRVPRTTAISILGQGGPAEILEIVAYVGALLLVVRAPFVDLRTTLGVLAALAVLAIFEVNPGDWLVKWIEIRPIDPGDSARIRWVNMILLGAAVAAIFMGLFLLARRPFLAALRAGVPEAWLASAGVILVLTAFVIDRYHATHFSWHRGYRFTHGVAFAAHVAEETMELMAALMFLAAAWIRVTRGIPGASGKK